MKYNEKVKKIRNSTGKEGVTLEGLDGKAVERMMYVYGVLLTNGPLSSPDIEKKSGLGRTIVRKALDDLYGHGYVTRAQLADVLGKPYIYTPAPVDNSKLPTGYTKEYCVKMERPAVAESPRAKHSETRLESNRDNPMTRALAKADISIPEGSLPSYKKALEDLRRIPKYGIKEIDDIIQTTIELVMDRCSNVNRQCPVCHGKLQMFGTEARCMSKRCGATADSKKSFEASLKMLEALAKVKE